MSQNVVNYSDNPTGPELLDNYLAKDQENCVTSNSGIQRPTYAQAGTVWLDNSTTPWTWYFYDGTTDIAIGTFNASTHEFISANFANVVNLTTPQTVAGLKTFTDKPRVPTPTSVDNIASVVNVDYMNNNLNGAVSTIKTSNLTTNRALVSNSSGKVDVSSVTSTELGYLSGVTSNVQTQLNNCSDDLNNKIQLVTSPGSTTGVLYCIPES